MNPSKVIHSTIMAVVILAVAGALYPTLQSYITNATGSGWSGTAILAVVSTLYWILISAGLVMYFMKAFGIGGKGKQY